MANPRASILSAMGALVDALVPPACAACDGPVDEASVLCAHCRESIEPAPSKNAHAAYACCAFGGAIADAVRAAKFRPDASVADALARFWIERLALGLCTLPRRGAHDGLDVGAAVDASAARAWAFDAVAFVPGPYRRRVKRGFDLPAVLARTLAKHARVHVVDALALTRVDAPLSFGADKAARAVAVAGRYRVRPSFARAYAGKRVLLVDDVHTTGATLAECARVLEAAGLSVDVAPFAVAP